MISSLLAEKQWSHSVDQREFHAASGGFPPVEATRGLRTSPSLVLLSEAAHSNEGYIRDVASQFVS